jgi:putative transposase
MFPITEFTKCLQGTMTSANLRIFLTLLQSFLCVRYETTTRGLSRYCEYSLRQIFRFLLVQHRWLEIRILLFKTFIYDKKAHYIIAVDEVVEGKSGYSSFGMDRFYSSCQQKTIKGVCFFALSLINIDTKSSYLLNILQVIYSPEDKQRIAEKKEKITQGKQRTKEGKNLPKGRPKKGIINEKSLVKPEIENLTASFCVFKVLFINSLMLLKNTILGIKITHLVADSAYGSLDYLKIALENSCFLISKMKSVASLYEPVEAEKGKRGRPKIYGKKIDLQNINQKYLKKTEQKEGSTHKYYQFDALSKALVGIKLSIVVLIVINEKGKFSTNVWFSNDLSINYETLLKYYSLRFQIEYHFREAKQHFGLSDFKNYKEQNLTNFINLSFTMCIVSKIILDKHRVETKNPKASILDLKIIYNAQFNAKKIIKYLGINDYNNFYSKMIAKYIPTEIINRL